MFMRAEAVYATLLFTLLLLGGPAAVLGAEVTHTDPLNSFVFGSCNKYSRPQPLWAAILDEKPDLFLWLGDALYLDRVHVIDFIRSPNPLTSMAEQYTLQKSHPEYRKFLDSGLPILGVWDDHDYGMNDGDATYTDREGAQKLFLDFIDEPADSVRRTRPGVYTSYLYGPPGRQVKFILLDVRYFANATTDDLLGKAQWEWLEREIDADSQDLLLIGTGIQMADTAKSIGEGWSFYPHSRQRLLRLIAKKVKSAVLVMSGDVHFAEFMKTYACDEDATPGLPITGVPVYEVTSSSLTHAWHRWKSWFNIPVWLIKVLFTFVAPADNRVGEFYADNNFCKISVNWEMKRVNVHVRGLDGSGIELDRSFAELGAERETSTDVSAKCWITDENVRSPPFKVSGIHLLQAASSAVVLFCMCCSVYWLGVRGSATAAGTEAKHE